MGKLAQYLIPFLNFTEEIEKYCLTNNCTKCAFNGGNNCLLEGNYSALKKFTPQEWQARIDAMEAQK